MEAEVQQSTHQTSSIDSLREKIKALEHQVSEHERSAALAAAEIAARNTELLEARHISEGFETKASGFQTEISRLKSLLAEDKAGREADQTLMKDLEAKLMDTSEAKEGIKRELAALLEQHEALQKDHGLKASTIASLHAQLESLSSNSQNSDIERQKRIVELEGAVAESRELIRERDDEISKLGNEKDTLTETLNALQSKVSEEVPQLEAKLKAQTGRVQGTDCSWHWKQRRTHLHAELQLANDAANASVSSLKEEITGLQTQLNALSDERNSLAVRAKENESEIERLSLQIQSLGEASSTEARDKAKALEFAHKEELKRVREERELLIVHRKFGLAFLKSRYYELAFSELESQLRERNALVEFLGQELKLAQSVKDEAERRVTEELSKHAAEDSSARGKLESQLAENASAINELQTELASKELEIQAIESERKELVEKLRLAEGKAQALEIEHAEQLRNKDSMIEAKVMAFNILEQQLVDSKADFEKEHASLEKLKAEASALEAENADCKQKIHVVLTVSLRETLNSFLS